MVCWWVVSSQVWPFDSISGSQRKYVSLRVEATPWELQISSFLKQNIFFKRFIEMGVSKKGSPFVGLACHGKDIVFRFTIECSSLMDFGP
jgi:hypothetical protein